MLRDTQVLVERAYQKWNWEVIADVVGVCPKINRALDAAAGSAAFVSYRFSRSHGFADHHGGVGGPARLDSDPHAHGTSSPRRHKRSQVHQTPPPVLPAAEPPVRGLSTGAASGAERVAPIDVCPKRGNLIIRKRRMRASPGWARSTDDGDGQVHQGPPRFECVCFIDRRGFRRARTALRARKRTGALGRAPLFRGAHERHDVAVRVLPWRRGPQSSRGPRRTDVPVGCMP